MTQVAIRFSVVAFAIMAALPTAVVGAQGVARVSGGGRADFVDTPHAVNTSGFTNFSVSVTVYSDGTASGHFVCQIPAVVIISGNVSHGWVNGNGSVTILGLGHGYDHFLGAPFMNLPFIVTLRGGGPGVGGFDYRDESGFFGPGQFDTEVIRRGMIRISD